MYGYLTGPCDHCIHYDMCAWKESRNSMDGYLERNGSNDCEGRPKSLRFGSICSSFYDPTVNCSE